MSYERVSLRNRKCLVKNREDSQNHKNCEFDSSIEIISGCPFSEKILQIWILSSFEKSVNFYKILFIKIFFENSFFFFLYFYLCKQLIKLIIRWQRTSVMTCEFAILIIILGNERTKMCYANENAYFMNVVQFFSSLFQI